MESHQLSLLILTVISGSFSDGRAHDIRQRPMLSIQKKFFPNNPQSFSFPQYELERSRTSQVSDSEVPNSANNKTLQIFRLGKGVVFCFLKEDLILFSTMYISRNNGDTFKDASVLLFDGLVAISNRTIPTINMKISRIYQPPQNNGLLVLVDSTNDVIFTTNNYAASFNASYVPFKPDTIVFDPSSGPNIFAYERESRGTQGQGAPTMGPATRDLWVSTDFGKSWKMAQKYVNSISYSPAANLYYIHKQEPGQPSVVVTLESGAFLEDMLQSSKVVEDVAEFAIQDDYMFYTKGLGDETDTASGSVQLWISHRHSPFVPATFATNFTVTNFHIAHISPTDGVMFVCLTYEDGLSDLYVSSPLTYSSETPFEFDISLQNIILLSTGSEDGATFAKLHPTIEAPGVFIADVQKLTCKVSYSTTMVTFDSGKFWKPISCSNSTETGCTLQILQQWSPPKFPLTFQPTISMQSFIIAKAKTHIYSKCPQSLLLVSTDGASTWSKRLLEGNYLFAVDAEVRVIVAIQRFTGTDKRADASVTDIFMYSTDKGATWNSKKFYSEKMGVIGVVKISALTNNRSVIQFIIVGITVRSSRWILVKTDPLNLSSKAEEPKEFMLLTSDDKRSIIRLDLSNLTRREYLLLPQNGRATALEFNVKRNAIYWADLTCKSVKKLSLGVNSPKMEIMTSFSQQKRSYNFALALDWILQNLYISDGKTIQVVQEAGGRNMRKVILRSPDLKFPVNLAVHPTKGYLFWTDFGFVGRSWLDGSNPQKIIFTSGKIQIERPFSLVIDFKEDRIYWVDQYLEQITSSDLDGRNFQIHSKSKLVYSIALRKNWLYLWNGDTAQLLGLNKTSTIQEGMLTEDVKFHALLNSPELRRAGNLKIFTADEHQIDGCDESNICALSTTCSHFCFYKPSTKSKNHKTRAHFCACPEEYFLCHDSIRCIPNSYMCNGKDNCGDNSDEINCPTSTPTTTAATTTYNPIRCDGDNFQCEDTRKCMDQFYRCDGKFDCEDETDERGCRDDEK